MPPLPAKSPRGSTNITHFLTPCPTPLSSVHGLGGQCLAPRTLAYSSGVPSGGFPFPEGSCFLAGLLRTLGFCGVPQEALRLPQSRRLPPSILPLGSQARLTIRRVAARTQAFSWLPRPPVRPRLPVTAAPGPVLPLSPPGALLLLPALPQSSLPQWVQPAKTSGPVGGNGAGSEKSRAQARLPGAPPSSGFSHSPGAGPEQVGLGK